MVKIPVIDLHEDVSMYYFSYGGGAGLADFNKDEKGREADIPKYKKGNVRIVFASIFPGVFTFEPKESEALEKLYGKWIPAITFRIPQPLIMEHFKIYYRLAEVHDISIINNYKDVDRALNSEGIAFLLHLEGAEAIDSPYDLLLLYKLGLRSIGLTWNYNNKYGSGCSSKKDYGLTPEGEELIELANRLGIIIDIAHANKSTAIEAIEVSKKPLIISHTNIRKFVDTPRNIDDEILEAVHDNKGIVGLSAISPLIKAKKRPTINDLIKHFMYVYERFGADNLAIGTDFLGLLGIPAPKGFESIDKVQYLLEKLKQQGVKESDIEKIAYKNALRVLRENLP